MSTSIIYIYIERVLDLVVSAYVRVVYYYPCALIFTLGAPFLNNNGSPILSRSPEKYPCAPPSQTVVERDPDFIILAIVWAGDALGNCDLYSAAAPAT